MAEMLQGSPCELLVLHNAGSLGRAKPQSGLRMRGRLAYAHELAEARSGGGLLL